MLAFRPMRRGDLAAIGERAAELAARPHLENAELEHRLLQDPHAETALLGEKPTAVGGIIDHHHGIAVAWLTVGCDAGPHALTLARHIRDRLGTLPYHWIEAQVRPGFTQSLRLCRLLGFVPVDGPNLVAPDGREFIRFVHRK